MKSVRVLIVDDNAGYLESARALLEHHPHVEVVAVARSGEEGVRLAAVLMPDLVLLELLMPGMERMMALRAIKTQPSPPCVAIVTFSQSDEDRRLAAEAGADAFIHKDRFVEDVFALINRLSPSSQGSGEPQV